MRTHMNAKLIIGLAVIGVFITILAWNNEVASDSRRDSSIPGVESVATTDLRHQDGLLEKESALEHSSGSRERVPDSLRVETSDPDSQSSAYRDRLYKDQITRLSHPEEYQEVITELAKGHIRRKLKEKEERVAASFCGFQTWDLLESKLTELEKSDPNLAVSLGQLASEGIRVASLTGDYSSSACEDFFHLEVAKYGNTDTRAAWMKMRETGKRGLYRFSSATTVGDRSFTLHFDSQFFPALESELELLHEQKTHFWEIAEDILK